ncbi:MAG: NADH:flavin oxidoreductase/NADH oxidase [Agromyces sp.]
MSVNVFTPITLRGREIRNRLWLPSLCQYSVTARDGIPTDWQLVHLGSIARGGAGLVLTEATAVTPDGRITDHDTGIWSDAHADAWRRTVDFVHEQGAVIGMQLAHAGRKASSWRDWPGGPTGTQPLSDGGWQTVAPSAIAFGHYAPPRELTVEEIHALIQAFIDGAKRALSAGVDLVEIHAAHGYLLHEFLSPLSNTRTDEWGGSLENRSRILRSIVRGVRALSDTPIFVRFSASDWVDGGWDVAQTAQVAQWLHEDGADFFDISSAGLVHDAKIAVGPNYQLPFAAEIHGDTGLDVSAVGLITTVEQANAIVQSGQAQAVMLGRAMMRDPHFVLRAAHHLGVDLPYWPRQYYRAKLTPGADW